MFTQKVLVGAIAIIAGVHCYFYLTTEQVHPCKAAEARLIGEYGLIVWKLGFGGLMTGGEFRGDTPEERKVAGKLETVGRFGVLGCYPPALLGWKVIPPV
jgi:hypothetical protein